MKRLLLSIVVCPLLLMSCVQEGKPDTEPAEGDGTAAMLSDALSATYAGHAALATVVDWEGNTLQEGSNGYTCMPTPPAFEARGAVSPMCLDDVWMAWANAWQNKTPFSTDRIGIAYMLAGDGGASNIDPWADGPTDDNEWIVEGAHLMLIVPNSSLLDGIPTDPSYGGPYVMWKGTDYEHVMVPVKATDVTDVAGLLEDALSAADTNMQAGVAAMDWEGNMLQEGDSGYTCMPTPPQFTLGRAPMCFDAPWLAWGDAWMNKKPFSTDQLGIAYMLSGDQGASNIDPYAVEPTDDNEWVQEGPHMMLIIPESAMLEGMTRDPDNGGPYVMWDGTPYVHIMVPIAGRP
jgi:hypothetical protein